jgi:hypothetical protein
MMTEFNDFNTRHDKYKSWGKLKKQMESLLCDALKNKISYFYTRYHKHRGSYGRAAIQYDKKELVSFSWDVGFDVQWADESKEFSKLDIQQYESIMNAQKQIHTELMLSKWMPDGTLYHLDFIHAAILYLQTDLQTALISDNYLLRIFAYMDRRVGKRTLSKIQNDINSLPEWVAQFYHIRCEAEDLQPNSF